MPPLLRSLADARLLPRQAELNLPHPLHPVLFFKPPTTLASPSEPIPIPPICQDSQMDYEVELALVLSRETRDVRPQDALDHVLGWTVANDLTARKWQGKCSQWGFCKGERSERSEERDERQRRDERFGCQSSPIVCQLCYGSAV